MKAEEFYQKEFGNADSIPKESVIRLLKNFAKALQLEREQALRIPDAVRQSEQCCSPTDGFYLGTTCLHCHKPFRKDIK